MRLLPTLLPFLLASSLLAAAPVDELLTRLGTCTDTSPVKVRVSHSFSRTTGEGKESRTEERLVKLTAQASPESGLVLSWDSDQLRSPGANAEKNSLSAIGPQSVFDFLNAAPVFSKRLNGAVLLEDKSDTFQGSPTRLLVVKLDPKLDAQSKKYIKQIEALAKIWLDPEGYPLAAETSVSLKGRAYLVITFDSAEKETYRFARVGGRLLVTQHDKTGGGSGAGEKATIQEQTKLELL